MSQRGCLAVSIFFLQLAVVGLYLQIPGALALVVLSVVFLFAAPFQDQP